MEFPRLLYRVGKQWKLESGSYDLLNVANQAEFDAASGWFLDQYAAKEAHEKEVQGEVQGDRPEEVLTKRQQLEAEAARLGVKVDKRWGDAKLEAAIEAAK